jgi:hypothetical protein
MKESGPRGGGQSDRWEEKRRRFETESGDSHPRGGLKPATLITIAVAALAVVFIAVFMLRPPAGQANAAAGAQAAAAGTIQQVATSAATVEGGKVAIPVDEVRAKKIVYWDYKEGGKNVPLMAYVTPSGAVKVAVRICEPCNGFAFHIEGKEIVCNTCGTRWDLETSKGVSGGCQGYPPDVLQSVQEGGKLLVDEAKVTGWKARA